MNKPGNNVVPIQPVAEEGNPNRLPFSLEEMLAEFDNGQVPRSTYWKAMIRALYETANHVVTGVTAVADVSPDNFGNIPLKAENIHAPTISNMEETINTFHVDIGLPWTPDTDITKMTYKVTNAGVSYVPISVPFTTSSTWNNDKDKWISVNKILAKGTTNSRSLEERFSDSINVKDFGAIGDGETDDSGAFQAAVNSLTSGSLFVPSGSYRIAATVEIPSGVKIVGLGRSSVIICESSATFFLKGSVQEEVPLAKEITSNTHNVSFIEPANYSPGDLIYIQSCINCLSSDAGSMQLGMSTGTSTQNVSWFAEFAEVHKTKGPSEVELLTPLAFNRYLLAPMPESGRRTTSTVCRVIPCIGASVSNLRFTIKANIGSVIRTEWAKDCEVQGCIFELGKFAATAVYVCNSYCCKVSNCNMAHDADTVVKYGDINPEAQDYYSFNDIKLVSSQGCIADNCTIVNGTQCIDVSYKEAPSLRNVIQNCLLINPRFNMLTTHSGSMDTLIQSNTGINCLSGISLRSRGERCIGNTILGFRGNDLTIGKNGTNYGIALSEGFTVNSLIEGNYIEGFYRGILFSDSTSRGFGHSYYRVSMISNQIVYTFTSVQINRDKNSPDFKTTDPSVITISNNVFLQSEHTYITISGDYLHDILISGNNFPDPLGHVDKYCIDIAENCKNATITNNTFTPLARHIRLGIITDTELLGPNTLSNQGIFDEGNVIFGNKPGKYVWGGAYVSDWGFTAAKGNYEYIKFQTVGDVSLDISSVNLLLISNSSGGMVYITNFVGGEQGQRLLIRGSSAASSTFVKSSTSIRTLDSADQVLSSYDLIEFCCVENSDFSEVRWVQV